MRTSAAERPFASVAPAVLAVALTVVLAVVILLLLAAILALSGFAVAPGSISAMIGG